MDDQTLPGRPASQRALPFGLTDAPTPPPPCPEVGPDALFAWRGGAVVLFAERSDGPTGARWVIARGWPSGDRLTDVRRWVFDTPVRFAGQVRRLSYEATGDHRAATDLARRALAWASAQDGPGRGTRLT
ncbi:MAG: hypothetical protein AVDCRST_MAG49-2815 [uncultured Thermomicrobiales bacterium]|uniref:Uncharacterized protein n=1 Tax=uncultured Thermomicrobiales bacterium TaxID=1645740 RepID=A0A6J4V2A4_9BACT|nr:MAG: hypothetical protein AVDCRST_MAG49-2815 [uncultured Thermomicrobiales bacterium]